MNRILLIIFASFLSVNYSAQDLHFSQNDFSVQLINPAAIGVFNGWDRVSFSHRQQWNAANAKFVTSQFNAETVLFKGNVNPKAHMGIGLNYYRDVAGDGKLGVNQAALTISGIVPLSKDHIISAGIQIGAFQRSVQASKLTFASQFDGAELNSTQLSGESAEYGSFIKPDIATGIMYTYEGKKSSFERNGLSRIQVGASFYHVAKPKLEYYSGSVDQLQRKLVLHASSDIEIPNSKVVLAPSIIYFMQKPHSEILPGLLLKYRLQEGTKYTGINQASYVSIGCLYRVEDAIIPRIGFEMKGFNVGVAVDLTTSNLKTTSGSFGAFEVSVQWTNLNTALFRTRKGKAFKTPN